MAIPAIPAGRNFATCYMELCKQQRQRPLPVISVTLPHSLDFTTDRVKMDDWGPILNSLSLDRSLRSITVRSRYQSRKPLEEVNSEDKARAMGKAPVVLTRYLLEWFSHSVAQCVRNSRNLTSLELEGIPFPPDCLAVLCVGLASTETLQYLSLQRCYIGDSGCELVCRTIADVQSITSLNLSNCDLTSSCGPALAAALSRQKLSLYDDTWKQSLRYREPNLEAMPGLRRLTLNENPQLGDSAVLEIIEAIRDSLWLKALDLQRCGITDRIAKELLELLDYNTTLVVLDVRLNSDLNDEVTKDIMRRLAMTENSKSSEYAWSRLYQKDQRTASAGSVRRREADNGRRAINRPKSAISNQVSRASQHIARRPPVPPTSLKRTKTKSCLPPPPQVSKASIKPQTRARPSIHLDLQAQIRSVVNDVNVEAADSSKTNSVEIRVDAEQESKEEKGEDEEEIEERLEEYEGLEKIDQLLRQLEEERAKHDRLLEETKRNEFLLAEERARREMAEANLRTMKAELAQLQNTLKEKEKETEGYLLVSQQSLDEICTSFDRLLETLDSVTKNPISARNEAKDVAMTKADIKRRVASVIRKTKSENLHRGYIVDVNGSQSPRFVDVTARCHRSEGDVRLTTLPPIAPVLLERNIGDSPDVDSPSMDEKVLWHRRLDKVPLSAAERARAIFAQILNGGGQVDFSVCVD